MSRPRMFGPAVCRLRSAESGPQPCSGRLITPAAGWRGASMSIHVYQNRRSLARRSQGTMAQLSVRLVVRPVVRLVVARPMVRLEARPVYHRRSPAAPDPYCVPAGPSMVLEETVKDMSSHPFWRASWGSRYVVGASWSLPPPAPVGRQEEFLVVAEVVSLLGTLVAQFTEVNRPRVDLYLSGVVHGA